MSAELDSDIAWLVSAITTFSEDVQFIASLSERRDIQHIRRAYVRAAFALIEGNMNLMSEVIQRSAQRNEVQLSKDELDLLRQEKTTVDSLGKENVRIKFIALKDRLAFVFDLFARIHGKNFRLDKSTEGWRAFIAAVDVRNRITHPKSRQDFDIADAEMDKLQEARDWFADSVESLLDVC